MIQRTSRSILTDSAMLIAITTGVCYVFGFIATTRRIRDYDIPWHLLPDVSLHQTLTVGALYLLFYLAVGLFIYLLYFYLNKRIKRLEAIQKYFRDRLLTHRITFSVFLGLIGSTILLIVPLYIYSPGIAIRILQAKTLPKVIELEIENENPISIVDSWNYISRKNGVFVFGLLDKKRLILIREQKVVKLIIELPGK